MSSPPPEVPRRKRKRRRRPASPLGEVSRTASLAAQAQRALDQLARELLLSLGRPISPALHLELPLALALAPHPSSAPSIPARAATLTASLTAHLDALTRASALYLEGHVTCFLTERADGPATTPPSPTDVFAGFAPNGRPEWISFQNLCLAHNEPRVDRLYASPPELLAIVSGADALSAGLLPGFGRDSLAYRVLGQIALGLLPEDLSLRSRAPRRALTLQVVETTTAHSPRRLHLNLIGFSRDEIAAAAAADPTQPAESLRQLLQRTRQRVDALARATPQSPSATPPMDLSERVLTLLHRLRSDLLRAFKSHDYRTQHAQDRHATGARPTAQAVTDALAAAEGRFYHDVHKDTVVVLGPKNRVHVFSLPGRHVTSLTLQPPEIERRIDLLRWRPLARTGSDLFKARLRTALAPADTSSPSTPHPEDDPT